jgi:DNA polymerase III epsilon subunit-like protein
MAKKKRSKKAQVLYPAPASGPKVLIFDIETAPILGYVWGLWDNNVALNQIHSDWHILSWSAKWLKSPEAEVMYLDQRGKKNIEDDKAILQKIWQLLDEADVVITQNGKNFDQKKLNARFILNGFQPPSSFKHIDTLQIAKKHFGFTSNKLAYMSDKLCVKYKKLDHAKFSGFELWKECLAGNLEAWNEMEVYNKHDVLALEELYEQLIPWDNSVNFNLYHDGVDNVCKCGSAAFIKNGYYYTNAGKFQKYRCKGCGHETRNKQNLLSKEKKDSLLPETAR